MWRFQLELIYYFTYFSTVVPSNSCVFLSCRPFVVNKTFQVLWVLKFLLSPGLNSWQFAFKSLIIVIVGFQNFVCCLAWAVDLWVQIPDEGRSLYIGSWWYLKVLINKSVAYSSQGSHTGQLDFCNWLEDRILLLLYPHYPPGSTSAIYPWWRTPMWHYFNRVFFMSTTILV